MYEFKTTPTLSRSCFSPRPSVPHGMKTLKNPQLSAIELSCRLPPVGPRGVRGRDRRSSQQASLSLFFYTPLSFASLFTPRETRHGTRNYGGLKVKCQAVSNSDWGSFKGLAALPKNIHINCLPAQELICQTLLQLTPFSQRATATVANSKCQPVPGASSLRVMQR